MTRVSPAVPFSIPLWTAYLGFVAVGLSNNVLGASWLLLRPTFDQPLSSVGVLFAATMVGSLLSSLTSGWILARVPVWAYCAVGSVLAAVGVLSYLGSSWVLIVAFTFLTGVGAGTLNGGFNTYVAAHYPASRMNWLHACYGLGSSLGPFLFTLWAFSLSLPWRWTYAGIAAVYLLMAALCLVYRRRWEPLRFREARGVSEGAARAGLRSTLAFGGVWLAMGLFFVHNGTSMSTGGLVSSLFALGRNVPEATAGNAAALYWACVMVGRLLVGVVIDRVGGVRLLRVATAVAVFGAFALWIAPWLAPTPALGFVALALMGVTFAPVYPTMISRTPELVGPERSAYAIGLQTAAASLGSAALPWLLGGVAEGGKVEFIAAGLFILAVIQFTLHEALVRRGGRPVLAAQEVR